MNFSRQRTSPISAGEIINYKNVDLLRRFITEQGKILPRRLTGVTAKAATSTCKSSETSPYFRIFTISL